jgi:prepilin peptidase CpaA
MSPWLFPSIALITAAIAAGTDLRSGRIPNALTIPAILLGLTGNSLAQGLAGCAGSLAGAVICGAVPGLVYKMSQGRGIGGGDIKLFAALGALLGPTQGLEVELSSFLLVGVFALFRLAFIGQLIRTLVQSLRVAVGLLVPKLGGPKLDDSVTMTTMRMGPAILAAVVTILSLPYLTRWLPWLG